MAGLDDELDNLLASQGVTPPPPAYGALEAGNIDLSRRPHVRNADGSVSTVRSMGVNMDGREYLIPTVSDDGRVMGDDEAIDYFKRTGKHLGVYQSPEAATAAAEAIHTDQERNMPANTLAEASPEDGELDALLAGADPVAAAAQAEAARAPIAPRRFNMLTPQGELVNVGEEHAEESYRQGYRLDASEAPTTGTVQLFERGRVNTYDAADPVVRERFAAGAQLATPDEIETEYGDVGSQIATGAEGVAQGATMGLYGLAADRVGGADYRAERQLREEANPITAVTANVAGAVAPALLSGGTGALGAAVRLTPAGRLANLSGRLATQLAPATTAGRIGLGAALGAGEGAIDNAARQVFDDLGAGNVDGFAERALDAAWEGAKWGGLFGGGLTAAGEAGEKIAAKFGKARGAADDAGPTPTDGSEAMPDEPPPAPGRPRQEVDADLDIAQQQLAEADAGGNPQVIEEAEDRIAQLIQEQENAVLAESGLTSDATIEGTLNVAPGPEAQGILAKLDQNLNKAKNAQELKFKLKDEADKLAVSVEGDLDNLQRFQTNTFDTYTNRSNKPKVIKKQLEEEGVVWTASEADRWMNRVNKMEAVLDDMTSVRKHAIYSTKQLKDFEAGRNSLKKLKEHLTGIKDGSQGPTGNARIFRGTLDDIAETIHAADLFKTHLGSFARTLGARPATTSEATFQRLYMGLRADLQNPKMVGKGFADFQTVNNAAITRAIRKADNFQRVAGRAGTSEGGGQFGFADVTEYDAKKLGAIFDNLADPRAHKDARDFIAGLTSKVELMETQAKYYPMPDEALAEIRQARETLTSITEKLRATQDIARKSAEASRLAAQTSDMEVILNGLRNIPVGGAAIATVAGAVKGLAGSVVSMAKGAVKSERAIDEAANATAKTFFRGPPEVPPAPAAAGPKSLPGGVGISANAVRRAIEDSEALQDPQSERSKQMARQLDDVRQESPELAQAIEQKVLAKAEFILSKLPPVDTRDPFARGGDRPMDKFTELRVARYVAAAHDPKGTLKRMSQGLGTMEDVETMKALFPQMFDGYRNRLVAQAEKAKVPPNAGQRAYLHMITGIPMSLEQQPEYIASMAEMGSAPPPAAEPAPNNSRRPKFRFGGESFGSRSDQILSESIDG